MTVKQLKSAAGFTLVEVIAPPSAPSAVDTVVTPDVTYTTCSDGMRPVCYKLERLKSA